MDIKDLIIPDSEESDIELWVNRMKQICFEMEPKPDQLFPTFELIFQKLQNETHKDIQWYKQILQQRYLEFIQSDEFNKLTKKRIFEHVSI